jgi:hypothetical protein
MVNVLAACVGSSQRSSSITLQGLFRQLNIHRLFSAVCSAFSSVASGVSTISLERIMLRLTTSVLMFVSTMQLVQAAAEIVGTQSSKKQFSSPRFFGCNPGFMKAK